MIGQAWLSWPLIGQTSSYIPSLPVGNVPNCQLGNVPNYAGWNTILSIILQTGENSSVPDHVTLVECTRARGPSVGPIPALLDPVFKPEYSLHLIMKVVTYLYHMKLKKSLRKVWKILS